MMRMDGAQFPYVQEKVRVKTEDCGVETNHIVSENTTSTGSATDSGTSTPIGVRLYPATNFA